MTSMKSSKRVFDRRKGKQHLLREGRNWFCPAQSRSLPEAHSSLLAEFVYLAHFAAQESLEGNTRAHELSLCR